MVKLIKLDLGCGYSNNIRFHKRREGIGIDLFKGNCDIIADIHKLPFKNNIFDFVYARNVLEHLDKSFNGLNEIKRVMKSNAKISITIPIYHNAMIDEILHILWGFPLRFWRTLKRLKRINKNKYKKGYLHKNNITPNYIMKFFVVSKLIKIYSIHPLTRFLKRKIYFPFAEIYYIYGEKIG